MLCYGPTNTFWLRICLFLRLFLAPLLGESAPGNLGQANLDFSSTKVKKPQPSVNLGTLGRNFGQKAWSKREEDIKAHPTVEVKRDVDVDLSSSDEETLAVGLSSQATDTDLLIPTYKTSLLRYIHRYWTFIFNSKKTRFDQTQALLLCDLRASYRCN